MRAAGRWRIGFIGIAVAFGLLLHVREWGETLSVER
jgi:hypothetical protein